MNRPLLALCVLVVPSLASAGLMTMTFDDMQNASLDPDVYTEDGITATGGRAYIQQSSDSMLIAYGAPPYQRTVDFTTGGLFTPISVDLDPIASGYCGGLCVDEPENSSGDGRIPYITISGYLQDALMGSMNFYRPGADPFYTQSLEFLGELDLLRIGVGYDIGEGPDTRICFAGCGEMRIDNLKLAPKSVPEPATLSLLAIGILGALGSRRRRRGVFMQCRPDQNGSARD